MEKKTSGSKDPSAMRSKGLCLKPWPTLEKLIPSHGECAQGCSI